MPVTPRPSGRHGAALAATLLLGIASIANAVTADVVVGGTSDARVPARAEVALPTPPTSSLPTGEVAGARSSKRSRGAAVRGAGALVPQSAAKSRSVLRPAVVVPSVRASVESIGTGASKTGDAPAFRGRNHVWIPSLGIDRSTRFFACSSSAYPGDRLYRWGCAGSRNVYLFGHAHSVFKPLHDAYVRGRLKKGMDLWYADGGGRVRHYEVAWWRVTTPDKGAWAYAAQSRPSVTLQTCVGSKSQYRLIVRLTLAD